MSKDNLLWKLDVLETQLAKDPSHSRLYRTKFAAERKPKSAELPPQELEKLIRDTKRQLVDRKIYHSIVQTQRALKSAINLELLKLKRRIKKTDGDEKKKAGLEEELKAILKLKEMNISKYLIHKQLYRTYVTRDDSEPEFINPEVLMEVKKTKSNSELGNDKSIKNVISRLCNSNGMKVVFDEMIRSIDHVVIRERRENDKGNKERKEKENDKEYSRRLKESSKESQTNGDDKGNSSSSEDEFYDKSDDMVAGRHSEDGDRITTKTENREKKSKDQNGLEEDSASDNDSGSDFGQDDFFSGNLPMLATGYVSGSDDEDNYDYDNDNVVKQVVSERKNRRGQRARRKIWEMKYGKGAKHLVKEREEKYAKALKRHQEFEEREARRQTKRAKFGEGSDSAVQKPELAQKKFKAAVDSDKPLHPSWEAKRKQKASITSFQGKKVKFD